MEQHDYRVWRGGGVIVPVAGALCPWLGMCVPSGSPQRHLGVACQGGGFGGPMHWSGVTAESAGQQPGKGKSWFLLWELFALGDVHLGFAGLWMGQYDFG